MNKKIVYILAAIMMTSILFTGCKEVEKDTEVVFTSEFVADEVFRIDSKSCFLPEIKVYLKTSQAQYESVFGNEIWSKDIGGRTLGDDIKSNILARLAQIKVMNLLAEKYELSLSEEQEKKVQEAARSYISELSDDEIERMGISRDIISDMYREYALACAVYDEITKDVNPEISDDEARTISVKDILIKTYSLDSKGEKVPYTQSQKREALLKASSALNEINAGGDFDDIAAKYNEDKEVNYSFGKGVMPETFEEAAFNLNTDQVSQIVETDYGYHIIKCVSTFDKEQTDVNKQRIVQERKNEVFTQVYSEFVKTLYSNLNEELWESVDFDDKNEIKATNFFDIYDGIENS